MQFCPLCKTEYVDIAKVCPLEHCNNCGSLKLKIQLTRSFDNKLVKSNFIYGTALIGFFAIFYNYVITLSKGNWLGFLIILLIFVIIDVFVFLIKTKQNVNCKSCKAKNFKSLIDIKLKKVRKQNVEAVLSDEDVSEITPQTVLDELSKEQKKHNRKDTLIKIGGIVATLIILLIANFFVNPQEILLETSFGEIPIEQNPIMSWLLQDGEHGSVYVDKKLGFMIEKPDENWLFLKEVEKFDERYNISLNYENFLGGILIGRHTGESVFVVVFDVNEISNIGLSGFIDSQVESAIKSLEQEIILKRKYVSPENNYAYWEAETISNRPSGKIYGSQILRIYNEKLFLIQQTADPPEVIADERNEEIKQIIRSFRYLN